MRPVISVLKGLAPLREIDVLRILRKMDIPFVSIALRRKEHPERGNFISVFRVPPINVALGLSVESDSGLTKYIYNLFPLKDGKETDPYINVSGSYSLEEVTGEEAVRSLTNAYNSYFFPETKPADLHLLK